MFNFIFSVTYYRVTKSD